MTENCCKHCKFWKSRDAIAKSWTFANADDYHYGRCNRISDGVEIEVDITSGWEGHAIRGLNTAASFGCNKFESA